MSGSSATEGRGPKTIFIVVHQGFAARSLLRTGVLPVLRAGAGVRIVILSPNHDEPYMRTEFGGMDVRLERLRLGKILVDQSRLWWLLWAIRSFTLGNARKTPALQEKYAGFQARLRTRQPKIVAWCLDAAVRALRRSRICRRLLLALETNLFRSQPHRDLFEKYTPDLVVTSSPGWFISDAVVLREARRHRTATASVVLGWDNPTSKGYRGADPDRIVVWSDRMAGQLVEHHDFPRERIFAGGVPQLDHYLRHGALLSREGLCHGLGLDPERRIVLFATSAPDAFPHNVMVAEALARAAAGERLGAPAQLVVRLHPINFRPDHRPPIEEYEKLCARVPHVHLDIPEILSEVLRCDMPASDSVRLGSLLKHCDVLVNVFSTTTLEAFLVDRPVVLVSPEIDGERECRSREVRFPRAFEDYAHVRSVIEAPAARVAGSTAELVDLVRTYLADPALDRAGRLEVARRECGPTDGRAGERIGRHLLALIGTDAADPPAPREAAPAGDRERLGAPTG